MTSVGRGNTSVTVIKGSFVDISANSSKTSNSSYLEMTSPSNSTATHNGSDIPVEYIIGIVVGVFVYLCIYVFIVCALAKCCPFTFCAPRCCCCLLRDFRSSTLTETIPGRSEERRQEDGSGSSNSATRNVTCVETNNGCSGDCNCCGGSAGCCGGGDYCCDGNDVCCDGIVGCCGECGGFCEGSGDCGNFDCGACCVG